jgi:hypothetical protein
MNKLAFKFRGLGVIVALAVIAGFAAVTMLLWNSLMPDIAGLSALSYWQALGVLALSRILFSGFSGIGGGLGDIKRRHGGDFRHENALRGKWMHMSEEERMAFFKKERDLRSTYNGRFGRPHEFCDGGSASGAFRGGDNNGDAGINNSDDGVNKRGAGAQGGKNE